MDGGLNADWIAELETVATACGPRRKGVNLFTVADTLVARVASEGTVSIPQPLRTFSTSHAAFNLNRKPDISQISINTLTEALKLPDLHPALLDFFSNHSIDPSVHRIGGCRRAHANTQLPFTDVIVWYSLRVQTYSMDNESITDPRRLSVLPPCEPWPLGRYDTALFIHDSTNPSLSPGVRLDGEFFH